MIFHLPGNELSVMSSKAETPFSSGRLKPGLTPVTLNGSSLSPTVVMQNSVLKHYALGPGAVRQDTSPFLCCAPWVVLFARSTPPRGVRLAQAYHLPVPKGVRRWPAPGRLR